MKENQADLWWVISDKSPTAWSKDTLLLWEIT